MPQQSNSGIVQRVSDYLFPARKVLKKAAGIEPDVQATDQATPVEVGMGPAAMLKQNEDQMLKRKKALQDAMAKSKAPGK